MAADSAKVLTQIIGLLEPLGEQDRQRMVRAALIFLGSDDAKDPLGEKDKDSGKSDTPDGANGAQNGARAAAWMKQNGVKPADLESIFHFGDGVVEIIAADLPGKSGGEKTKQCYLLTGIKNLLASDEPKIDDKEARTLCGKMGCYDSNNHAAYVKGLGNAARGSKQAGYELTQPGMRAAAKIIIGMAGTQDE